RARPGARLAGLFDCAPRARRGAGEVSAMRRPGLRSRLQRYSDVRQCRAYGVVGLAGSGEARWEVASLCEPARGPARPRQDQRGRRLTAERRLSNAGQLAAAPRRVTSEATLVDPVAVELTAAGPLSAAPASPLQGPAALLPW